MRLFLSIDIPQEIKDRALAIQKCVPSDSSRIVMVKPDKMHITLQFLGEKDEKDIEQIVERVEEGVKDAVPFVIEAAGMDIFSSEDHIKIIYISLKDIGGNIKKLISKIKEQLGILKKEKEIVPHITIARVRYVKDKRDLIAYINSNKYISLGQFKVNSVRLYKSELTPSGPVYSMVHEFPLLKQGRI